MDNLKDVLKLTHNLTPQKFKKGEIIQKQGDRTLKGFFVQKGLLRSYTIDAKGKEHIFMFASENWLISDIESFEFYEPAVLNIECIEDSEVFILNRDMINNNDLENQQLRNMLQLLRRRVAVLQRRILSLMSASATERYEYFLKDYPNLPNRVPQWMIASYLGITPEALSKIRGQIARDK